MKIKLGIAALMSLTMLSLATPAQAATTYTPRYDQCTIGVPAAVDPTIQLYIVDRRNDAKQHHISTMEVKTMNTGLIGKVHFVIRRKDTGAIVAQASKNVIFPGTAKIRWVDVDSSHGQTIAGLVAVAQVWNGTDDYSCTNSITVVG